MPLKKSQPKPRFRRGRAHAAFVTRITRLLARGQRSPKAAAAGCLALAREAETAAESAISDWHVDQALGLAAMALEKAGDHDGAEQVLRELVQRHRAALNGHGHGIAFQLGQLSLACFRTGKQEEAVAFSYEALRYFGQHPEPCYLIETLGRKLRQHQRQQDRRRRSAK